MKTERAPDVAAALSAASEAAAALSWDKAAGLLAGLDDSDDVLKARGFYSSRAGRYEDAIRDFEALRERRPHDHLPVYMLAYQHYERGDYALAVALFKKATVLEPTHIKSWWRLAAAHVRRGHTSRAQVAAARVVRLWRNSSEEVRKRDRKYYARANYLLGKEQLREEPEAAAEFLAEAVRYEPDDPNKHYRLASALRRLGRLREANVELERAREARKPAPPLAYVELEFAALCVDEGRPIEAVALVERMSAQLQGWIGVKAARVLMDAGRPDLAEPILVRVATKGPTRGHPRVKQLLDGVRACTASYPRSAPESRSAPKPRSDEAVGRRKGKVVGVRADRGFAFLVDLVDGVDRYFRLLSGATFQKGEGVTFVPGDAPRGPVAHDVEHC